MTEGKIIQLRGTPYRVLIRGATVVLEFGGKELPPMHPDDAIDVAQGMFYASKRVKERYRMGSMMHGLADLTDAVKDELEEQKAADGTAAFKIAKSG